MKNVFLKFPLLVFAFLAFSLTSCDGISDFLDDDDDDYCEDEYGRSCDDDDEIKINPDDLPDMILQYISSNFPNETIVHATYEAGEPHEAYEVYLSNGIELYFNQDGEFVEMDTDDDGDGDGDCDGMDDDEVAISPSDLPSVILQYIEANFPNATITKATYEADEPQEAYEVYLSNGIELYFNQNGEFVEMDTDDDDDDDDCGNSN